MPLRKSQSEINALILGNNSYLEEEIKKFLHNKQIKIIPTKTTFTPIARYNIFILDLNNPSLGNLNQLVDILHQGNSSHKFIFILQKSNLTPENKNLPSLEIFKQLSHERNLDARIVRLWDIVSLDPHRPLSPIDKTLKQAVVTSSINVSRDASLYYYPLNLSDFLRALAKIIFTQKTTNQQYTLAGPKYSDLDLSLILKKVLNKKNLNLNIDQNLDISQDSRVNPQAEADTTSARLNWVPQVDPEEILDRLVQIADSSAIYTPIAPITPNPIFPKKPLSKIKTRTPTSKTKIIDGPIKKIEFKWFVKTALSFAVSIIFLIVFSLSVFYFFISSSINKLNSAVVQIQTEDIKSVSSLINSSQRRLALSQVIYAPFSSLVSFISSGLSANLNNLFLVLRYSQNSLNQVYTIKNISQSAYADSLNKQDVDIKQISASLLSSLQRLQSQLNQLIFYVSSSADIPILKTKNIFTANQKNLESLSAQTDLAISFSQVLPFIFPPGQLTNILILVQDNNEYRPTGGWFNSYIYLSFRGNRLIKTQADSSLSLTGKIEGLVAPPPALSKLTGTENWQIHDANFYPNFPDSAKQISWFWQKITSANINTVVAVNLNFIKDILKTQEPLKLENNTKVTADNLDLLLLSPTLDKKTDILTQVVKKLTSKLENKQLSFNAVSRAFLNSLKSSNLYIYSNNKKAQNIIQKNAFAGLISPLDCPVRFNLTPCSSLFFSFNEANFSANKSNFYQNRQINHKIDIKKDGSFSHLIQVNYSYPNPVPNLSSSVYQALINLYLPASYQLDSISLDGVSIEEKNIKTQINGEVAQTTFPLNFVLNQNHKLAISTTSSVPMDLSNQSTNLALYTIKQSGSQNTTQKVEITYPENLFPKTISLPFTQTPNSIVFDRMQNSTTTYAINFLLRN